MNRPPVPPLRYDAGQTESCSTVGIDAGQQRAELGRNAQPGFLLEEAWLDDIFEKHTVCRKTAHATRRKRRLELALNNDLPSLRKAVVENHPRSYQRFLRSVPLP